MNNTRQFVSSQVHIIEIYEMASIIPAMTEQTKPPSRTADQFVVRLPEGMRESIAEAAKSNGRSMNAEIVARLQGDTPSSSAQPLIEVIARQNATIAELELDLHSLRLSAIAAASVVRNLSGLLKKSDFARSPGMDAIFAVAERVSEPFPMNELQELRARGTEKLKKLSDAQDRLAEIIKSSTDPLPVSSTEKAVKRILRTPLKKKS